MDFDGMFTPPYSKIWGFLIRTRGIRFVQISKLTADALSRPPSLWLLEFLERRQLWNGLNGLNGLPIFWVIQDASTARQKDRRICIKLTNYVYIQTVYSCIFIIRWYYIIGFYNTEDLSKMIYEDLGSSQHLCILRLLGFYGRGCRKQYVCLSVCFVKDPLWNVWTSWEWMESPCIHNLQVESKGTNSSNGFWIENWSFNIPLKGS